MKKLPILLIAIFFFFTLSINARFPVSEQHAGPSNVFAAADGEFDFDDESRQGWTLEGAYDPDGGGEPLNSAFSIVWEDTYNFPNPPGADTSGDTQGALGMTTFEGHGIDNPEGTWWIMQFHSPDLSESVAWQNAVGYTVKIAEGMSGGDATLYANLFVRVYDLNEERDRFYYNGDAQPLIYAATWNSFSLEWQNMTDFPSDYILREVFVNIWGLLEENTLQGGVYLDDVISINRPDLSIVSIQTSPLEPIAGQVVNIAITVENEDIVDSGAFDIEWYGDLNVPPGTDDIGDRSVNVAALARGEIYVFNTTWTYSSAGTFNMYAYVDRQNNVFESDEENNIFGSQSIVVLPDNDADGYAPPEDCDDNDNSVYPGAPEICDGKDNDCNSETSDGAQEDWIGNACDGSDTDLCTEGTLGCIEGAQLCSDNTGDNLELCDGVDNDCNPETADGTGENWFNEPCDGTDTDLCTEGSWSCVGEEQFCTDDTGDDIELCDNLDNDCNGTIDDNLTRPTTCGVGICAGNTGEETCTNGVWGDDTCDPFDGATVEICDGLDNDCNPDTPDGLDETWMGQICDGTDGDICPEGRRQCVDGLPECSDYTGTNDDGSCTPAADSPVTVRPDHRVKITFDYVSTGGQTTVSESFCPSEVPDGYSINPDGTCFEIITTATGFESMEICISIPKGYFHETELNRLGMWRCDESGTTCESLPFSSWILCQDPTICTTVNEGILCATTTNWYGRVAYVLEPDSDNDGWADSRDNCPNFYDPSNQYVCIGDYDADDDVDGSDLDVLSEGGHRESVTGFAPYFGTEGHTQ